MQQILTRTTTFVLLALLATACAKTDDATPNPITTQPALTEHLTLGNPSGSTMDPGQPTNYLLSKSQYALSYHRD
ncbi:hypothetical protein ACFQ48_16830 [Hymenobacter caeli]|uniref:DNA/RNA endonuclease G (NUC1) n=1 Tax=Hymenobacter caeli TaxID=2735894 RepID=A0ABX2FS96_9BACT|nr:hypothetical protein [Hymenobacter caeli]NRT19371.1 DNA/RNA endonuclease G (NUC1) [Hymenobacter caeli]